jgi:hypothetical protein
MSEPVTSPSDLVHFQARHRPALPSGMYSVTVKHQISFTGVTPDRIANADTDTKFASDPLHFGVFGPRYVLHDSDIEAEFPPSNARGQFGEVLPHIILSRPTLPWERSGSAAAGDDATRFPWLALLVFSEGEVQVSNLTVGTIRPTNPLSPIRTATLSGEAADVATDPVTCIDVDFSLLKQLLPDPANAATHFSLLTHTRFIDFTDPKNGGTIRSEERSVVVASRLPEQGKRIQAHLVSLEGCYESTPSGLQFLGGRPVDSNKIRLISLYSWDFFCQSDDADSFENIVGRLNRGRLRLDSAVVTNGSAAAQQEARRFLDSGFIPLVHRFRQGDTSASWYHGPLLPTATPPVASAPPQFAGARAADDLLLYNARQGLFDVSYAAAWELGRLLMLENTRLAAALYQWKRARAQAQAARDAMSQPVRAQGAPLSALPLGATPPAAGQPPFPAEVAAWFQQHLGLLTGVPFPYLVPDEGYLPKESLRFFFLDPVWMSCLFDGAFAIARTRVKDIQLDNTLRAELPPVSAVGGILIRSAAVAGWPGLSVDAYPNTTVAPRNDPAPNKLNIVRREQLAPNVLLVLFDGAPRAVDLHLAPETIHFGIDEPQNGVFHKTLRATVNPGILRSVTPGAQVNVPAPNSKSRLDMVALAANVLSAARGTAVSPTAFTDADLASFALEMIESVPVKRFTLS